MTEQQNHLRELLTQTDEIKRDIDNLNTQAQQKRDLLLRAAGAIEYLQQIGVTLEESTPVQVPAEAQGSTPQEPTEPTEPTEEVEG